MKLGEICRFKYGEMPKKSDLSEQGYPVYSGYRLVGHSPRYHYQDSEIIVVARGVGGTGDIKMAPPFCFLTNLSIAILIETPDVYKPFLYYRLASTTLWELRTGSAQAQITIERLKTYEVSVPPLPIQRRIAGILSAYDELIETSQRRIKILESMARALYREWFVNFRFPGHESVPRVPSPIGEIPQGWEVQRLGAITIKIGSGSTPRGGKGAYKSEGIHFIRSLNVYDYSFEFDQLAYIDQQQAAELDNVQVEKDDILLNITGASVARCTLMLSYLLPARVNQHVAIVRVDPAKVSALYLLDAINSAERKQQLLTLAQGGATREALTKETISNLNFALPPAPLMKGYDAIARAIHTQREVLLRQVQILRRTRDLLLPRLLAGQIDVESMKSR